MHQVSALAIAAALAFAALAFAALAPSTASADEASVSRGQSIFESRGACQACHGWAADGVKMDNQMPDGANLRETTLDRETLIETIRCGRPGREMPAFERNAYSDGRCYGMRTADLQAAGGLPDPAATLSVSEVEAVVDFLFAKVIGKGPMTKEKCVEFFGHPSRVCDLVP
jgi:cytochrome c553